MQGGFFQNVIVLQCPTIFQLLSSKYQALLVRRNAFLILQLLLHALNRVVWIHFQSQRLASKCLHKDLHAAEALVVDFALIVDFTPALCLFLNLGFLDHLQHSFNMPFHSGQALTS